MTNFAFYILKINQVSHYYNDTQSIRVRKLTRLCLYHSVTDCSVYRNECNRESEIGKYRNKSKMYY